MHVQSALRTELPSQLTDGLQERLSLDVADGSAYFCYHEIEMFLGGIQQNPAFYLVGDMRHHLNRLAEIVAAAFAFNDAEVDAPCRYAVVARRLDARETFVVPKVEVGFKAVGSNVAFTMLVRVQRARVNVDVWVEFLDCYLISAGLQKLTQRG